MFVSSVLTGAAQIIQRYMPNMIAHKHAFMLPHRGGNVELIALVASSGADELLLYNLVLYQKPKRLPQVRLCILRELMEIPTGLQGSQLQGRDRERPTG